MKKLFVFVLCMAMVLPILIGCGPVEHTLRVGFGRVDITPEEIVPLRGYGNTSQRPGLEVKDPLYASCIAFTDEKDNTILLFYTDLIGEAGGVFPASRAAIAEATGIPVERIMISGTHMHSGPDMGNTSHPAIPAYNKTLQGLLVDAAKAALEDRKPGKLFTAEAHPEGYNFIRHYVLSDGEVIGDNFGSLGSREYVGHVGDADNQMQLVKITREGGEDIVLANWQGHPHRAGGKNKLFITADLVGAMRDYVEKELGCRFAYFTGASGNVNSSSRIKTEMAAEDYLTHGQQLGEIAINALKECKPAAEGYVKMADKVLSLSMIGGDVKKDMPIYAFSIGDIGFICAPYEMFNANGMQIKEASKFETTFVVTCANENHSYIPSEEAYEYNSTEKPYEVRVCKYEPGTGELLAKEYEKLLNKVYRSRK
ncbi:MAG: hypothetical protein IKA47_13290 [Oscillospiraceae bacterium]|nr:hypothetical protein [Oscillospiraceae bacterium]